MSLELAPTSSSVTLNGPPGPLPSWWLHRRVSPRHVEMQRKRGEQQGAPHPALTKLNVFTCWLQTFT